MKTSFNKTLTKEEAAELLKAKGMSYPDTPHNRKMIASAVNDFLLTLRAGAQK